MFHALADVPQPPDLLSQLTSLGSAGVMGAMWLWERYTSRAREQQLDDAHARILADKVAVEELIGVVRQNAEALSRLTVTHEQLLRQLAGRGTP
jgi:hypothetical protein